MRIIAQVCIKAGHFHPIMSNYCFGDQQVNRMAPCWLEIRESFHCHVQELPQNGLPQSMET